MDGTAEPRLRERLQAAWKQRRPLPVTFSTGIARSHTSSIDAALQAADQRLYQHNYTQPSIYPPGSPPR